MKELILNIKEQIQAKGFQCITVRSYDDFCIKLNCMGGSYKGFIMAEHLNNFTLFYIDTDMMRSDAEAEFKDYSRMHFHMAPEARKYIDSQPEKFAEKCINGYYQRGYINTYKQKQEKFVKESGSKFKKIFGLQ